MANSTITLFAIAVGACVQACGGVIGDAEQPREPAQIPSQAPGTSPPDQCVSSLEVAEAPLHRLTASEYNRTVLDLLGDDSNPASIWPAAATSTGFDNSSAEQSTAATALMAIADSAASIAARARKRLPSLVPCDVAKANEACGRTFIETFARRAFRRPLVADDRTRLLSVYKIAVQADGFAGGIEAVIEAVLSSPHFLYRVEGSNAEAQGPVAITDHELAARLSYFLVGSMPDAELSALADAGRLHETTNLQREAKRLLASQRGHQTFADFYRQWLLLDQAVGVSKDATVYPSVNPNTMPALVRGAEEFMQWVTMDSPSANWRDLFLSNVVFANADSAWVFGANNVTGAGLQRLSSGEARYGILTLPAWLASVGGKAAGSAPVMRGKFMRHQFFCQGVPPPPAEVDTTVPPAATDTTTRERFAAHSTNKACASCHRLLDGLGFGLERYDGMGVYREQEFGETIDDAGELVGTEHSDGPFAGAGGLAEKLSDSLEARACFVRMWLRYGFARMDAPADNCFIEKLARAVSGTDFRLSEVPLAIATSTAFRMRAPSAGAAACSQGGNQ